MLAPRRYLHQPRALASTFNGAVVRAAFGASLMLGMVTGCGDDDSSSSDAGERDAGDEPHEHGKDGGTQPDKQDAGSKPGKHDAGPKPGKDAGNDHDDAGVAPYGGLVIDTTPSKQDLDLFGDPGHRFWLDVSKVQLERLNGGNNGGGFPGGGGGDIYTPVVSGSFADHVVVQDAKTGSVADYGKMEVKLVGESTGRQWTGETIPNIHIDTDEFQKKARIGGFEHFRLNNSVVGSIFREQIAHRIFRALGYPGLRASYGLLGSNVWGNDVWVPMTLIEVYKQRFCDDNEKLLGGTCENMWEFAGDLYNGNDNGGFPGGGGGPIIDDKPAGPGGGGPEIPGNYCQVKSCDNTRLSELSQLLSETPLGPGFADATDKYIEWDRFHEFQCLNWMLWIGDDPIHNSNNNLIIERDDGKMIWAPYSVDISAGQDWYQSVKLIGTNSIARGCQSDPKCWSDTIATCEKLITKFDKLNPEKFVDQTEKTLTDLDMMRDGDAQRASALRDWYVTRQTQLTEELDRYRYLPNIYNHCPMGLQRCGDENDPYSPATCGTPQQCEEWKCSIGSTWCSARESCVGPDESCPDCQKDAPFYCRASQTCVTSFDECQLMCETGYSFCPSVGNCVEDGYCPPEVDGGVEPGGGEEPGPIFSSKQQ